MKVLPSEKLTRFIQFKTGRYKEPNTVEHMTFLPRKEEVNISVFRISELPDEDAPTNSEVWEIGHQHVSTKERPVKAQADLLASSVYEINLEVISSEPPHRHADITSLPETNSPVNKVKRRSLATKLANASKLVLPPEDT